MEYENHLKTHIPSPTYDCEVCGFEGSSKKDMDKHIEKIHKCGVCNSLYKDVYELNRHKETKHNKKFSCNECEFTCSSEKVLKTHKAEHEAEKHTCEICSKQENSAKMLDDHMKSKHFKEIYDQFVQIKTKRSPKGKFRSNREIFSLKDKKDNGVCTYWKQGKCTYGEFCRFSHVETTECRFQERCARRSSCRFSHYENFQRRSFLGGAGRYQNQF